jgi:hypothetical protein
MARRRHGQALSIREARTMSARWQKRFARRKSQDSAAMIRKDRQR